MVSPIRHLCIDYTRRSQLFEWQNSKCTYRDNPMKYPSQKCTNHRYLFIHCLKPDYDVNISLDHFGKVAQLDTLAPRLPSRWVSASRTFGKC